jgi:hypothetical protein
MIRVDLHVTNVVKWSKTPNVGHFPQKADLCIVELLV